MASWSSGPSAFFEVEAVNAGVPVLGKELFKDKKGELRKQFVAVVDRSAIQVQAAPFAPAIATGTNGAKSWETKSMADAAVGSPTIIIEGSISGTSLQIFADGKPILYTPDAPGAGTPTNFHCGWEPAIKRRTAAKASGSECSRTRRNARGYGQRHTGYGLGSALSRIQRFHGGSTRVSNTIPGNPGPQSGFLPGLPANSHIVPYFTKLDP